MNTIKELRKKNKLSQIQLANAIGVHQTAVSNWEKEKNNPDTDCIKLLAKFFNVSVDYLLGNNEKKPIENYPISFEMFENGLSKRGINKTDLEALSAEQTKLLFDMLEQIIKAFKSNK